MDYILKYADVLTLLIAILTQLLTPILTRLLTHHYKKKQERKKIIEELRNLKYQLISKQGPESVENDSDWEQRLFDLLTYAHKSSFFDWFFSNPAKEEMNNYMKSKKDFIDDQMLSELCEVIDTLIDFLE